MFNSVESVDWSLAKIAKVARRNTDTKVASVTKSSAVFMQLMSVNKSSVIAQKTRSASVQSLVIQNFNCTLHSL